MKVLSWNVLADEWVKKSYYPTVKDLRLLDPEHRLPIQVKILKEEDADIILLQEVMPETYARLSRMFRKTHHISSLCLRHWSKTRPSVSGHMTLVRRTLCKDIREKELSFGQRVQAGTLVLYNIHLDDKSYALRRRQLNSIPLDEPYAIVGGDFNQMYKNPIPGFIQHNDCTTYFVEKYMDIDNIITKGIKKGKMCCKSIPISVSEGLLRYGSDHIPVILDI
jgi:endonuclease/exonuclease/phosphatase family metal-dependent hydrolase